MRKHVIVDFDNTMGVEACDVDDGLALLYLLGSDDVAIDAICTTYGNSTLQVVHDNTVRMLERLGLDIPLFRGAEKPGEFESDASRCLSQAARESGGGVHLVALGSLTNLHGAHRLDARFYEGLSGIYLMGGYTCSLPYHGSFIDELNFSCDPDAVFDVLSAADRAHAHTCPITIATAQACLPATFSRECFDREFGRSSWLTQACSSWFETMEWQFGWPHVVCWDVVAAAALVQPELFTVSPMDVTLYRRYLSVGFLEEAPAGAPSAVVSIPRINDAEEFVGEVFAAWHRGLERLGM